MELGPLLSELQALVGLLCSDEEVDPARIRRAVRGAVEIAPSLEQDAGRSLVTAVNALQDAAHAQQERTAERLQDLRSGKRAMKGYGSLRSHKSGQRVRVKA